MLKQLQVDNPISFYRNRIQADIFKKARRRRTVESYAQVKTAMEKEDEQNYENDYGIYVVTRKDGVELIKDALYDGIDKSEIKFSSLAPSALSLSQYICRRPVNIQVKVEGETPYEQAKFEVKQLMNEENEEVEMLVGTMQGDIFLFDPMLKGKAEIKILNSEKDPTLKKSKQVELVKWIEPAPGLTAPTRFLVVFEDGHIYIYNKDLASNKALDPDKDIIRTKPEGQFSKGQIMRKMY
mmetsp:Transcript_24543/g.24140  ORF Transcript_24543/g.24140 Transcript_24543/m.24140 type:complete len:239 (+) Transcript_24543:88-804(+)